MKPRYVVKRYDIVASKWVYYNTFMSFEEACEERDRLQKKYGGLFEIFF